MTTARGILPTDHDRDDADDEGLNADDTADDAYTMTSPL
jgi:hypothetical protein